MYKFVKMSHKYRKDVVGPWMLVCDNFDTLTEHNHKFLKPEMQEGVKELFELNYRAGHTSTNWGRTLESMMMITGDNLINAGNKLELDILNGKMNCIDEFGEIYLHENGSYTMAGKDTIIVETKNSDNLIYENYTKDDISITKWPDGSHYYGKIGRESVTDSNGNQKWNSAKVAQEKAEEYLKKLQNKGIK